MSSPTPTPVPLALARQAQRDDEVQDVLSLLLPCLDTSAGPPEQGRQVAQALAVACLGDNHLWQDLQLPSRAALSALIAHWFPAMAARNNRQMKWKKFFYRQLCEREEILICKSPSCAVCTDYAACFGPESG